MSVKQPRARKEHQPKKAPKTKATEKDKAPQKPPDPAQIGDQVADWLLAGNSAHDVLEAVHHTWPTITEPDARTLIAAVYQGMADRLDLSPRELAAWHREARRELYRKALEIHDYKTAHSILKELASLDGTGAQKARPPEPQPTFKDDGVPDGAGLDVPEAN